MLCIFNNTTTNNMRAPKQADLESQKTLTSITEDKKDEIILSSGRKVKVGWIRPDTQDKIDDISVQYEVLKKQIDENDKISMQKANVETRKQYSKIIAAILINNYFGLKLFWWAKWRIIHHFWHVNGDDALLIISEAKKKATEQQYFLAMALAMTMPETWTTMTRKEAEVYRQELESARKQQ